MIFQKTNTFVENNRQKYTNKVVLTLIIEVNKYFFFTSQKIDKQIIYLIFFSLTELKKKVTIYIKMNEILLFITKKFQNLNQSAYQTRKMDGIDPKLVKQTNKIKKEIVNY